MRFQKTKGFILGVLICVLISTMLMPALAQVATKQLTAHFQNIKVIVNGEPLIITMKDSSGNVVEPFTVDGRTYLPVNAVAQALGYSVSWDAESHTVYMYHEDDRTDNSGEAAETPSETSVWLKDMMPFTNDWVYTPLNSGDIRDNIGNSYSNYLYEPTKNNNVTYVLNGQYSRFSGGLVVLEQHKNTAKPFKFKIYLDDKVVYTSDLITRDSLPSEFSVNTTGALKMKVEFVYIVSGVEFAGTLCDCIALVDAKLEK